MTPSDRVVVITATNLLEQAVDYAADRRFDMIINFKRPGFQQRLDLLTILLKRFKLDSENMILLAKRTRYYTQADIKKIIKHALNKCLRSDRKLTINDLLSSLRYVKPTRSYNGEEEYD